MESKNFVVYCDSSQMDLGVVLMQDKNVKVHYLYGAKYEMFIYHCSMQYVSTQRDLNLSWRW